MYIASRCFLYKFSLDLVYFAKLEIVGSKIAGIIGDDGREINDKMD